MNLKRCCSYRNARQKLPQAADSALTEFPMKKLALAMAAALALLSLAGCGT
jgi:hypothetical protein